MVGYHSFIHQVFSEQLLHVTSLALGTGDSGEQARLDPCPHRAPGSQGHRHGVNDFKRSKLTAEKHCVLKEKVTSILASSTGSASLPGEARVTKPRGEISEASVGGGCGQRPRQRSTPSDGWNPSPRRPIPRSACPGSQGRRRGWHERQLERWAEPAVQGLEP